MIKLQKFSTYEKLSEAVIDIISLQIKRKPTSVLLLPTGSTPELMYKKLAQRVKRGKIDLSQVKIFMLDEYVGLPATDINSYHYFIENHLAKPANLNSSQIHLPDASNPAQYDADIALASGIDLAILGIGANGHIGFNEPVTEFNTKTHVTEIAEKTREDNSRFFGGDINKVPRQAVTAGLATILNSRAIIVLARATKAGIIGRVLAEKPTVEIPATILHKHADCKVYLEEV